MSKYRRYHPVNHNFNRDPQIIEARKQFGDWIGYAWLECLAIADRNDGVVPGTTEQIAEILAPISLQKYLKPSAKRAQNFLKFAEDCGWIYTENNYILIVNYREYHRSRGANSAPSEPNLTIPKHNKKKTNTSHFDQNGPANWPNPYLLIQKYNSTVCDDLPAVEKITPARIKKANDYLNLFPEESFWTEVFQEINNSLFLRGKSNALGHGNFKANFDWLLTKGKDGTENAAKVFEGRYRNGP